MEVEESVAASEMSTRRQILRRDFETNTQEVGVDEGDIIETDGITSFVRHITNSTSSTLTRSKS